MTKIAVILSSFVTESFLLTLSATLHIRSASAMGDTSLRDIKIRSGQEQLAGPLEPQPPPPSFRKGCGFSRALVKE